MKRYMVLVLMMVSAAALFANGAGEQSERPLVTGEEIELTGTLEFVDGHPVLNADGSTYLLGAPRAGWYVDQIEEGGTITVEGYLQEEPVGPTTDVASDGHVAVTSATYNGEEISFENGMPGGARGRMGSWNEDDRGAGPSADDEWERGSRRSSRERAPARGRR